MIEGGYTLIASRVALAQGLGEGNKAIDMPPPAALDDAAPAPRGNRMTDGRGARADATSWVREIYDPGEYTGSVAAPKPRSRTRRKLPRPRTAPPATPRRRSMRSSRR